MITNLSTAVSAAEILINAHRELEKLTLSSLQLKVKEQLSLHYCELIHEGKQLDPACNDIESFFMSSQKYVSGTVRLKLYKGSVSTVGRWSEYSLYSEKHVTFEDDAGAYDQNDAAGFIQLNALRLKLLAHQKLRNK